MKSRKGFTIVEVVVIITTIALLTGLGIAGLNWHLSSSRDEVRLSKANVVANSLEKYYEENGEYPSPLAISGTIPENSGSVVAELLGIERDNLTFPSSHEEVTNVIVTTPVANEDVLVYSATATPLSRCTGSASGGCDSFSLSFVNDLDGQTVTIRSLKGN